MASGIELINKIDAVLVDLSKTRKQFAEQLKLAPSTMATWKSNDALPPVDTVALIAHELDVSTGWLIDGDIDFEERDSIKREYSRKAIRLRIYAALANKYLEKDPDCPDFKEGFLTDEDRLKLIHNQYFGVGYGYPSYMALRNWSKGRCEIDEYCFTRWAQNLNTTIQFLLTGSGMHEPSADGDAQDFDEGLYNLAKKFPNELRCLDNYSPERQQLAKKLLNELMYLEDYEYKDKNKQNK